MFAELRAQLLLICFVACAPVVFGTEAELVSVNFYGK